MNVKPNRPPTPTPSHVLSLLCVPLSSPLAGGVTMACQPLLVDLLSLLLPAQVLRPLPARHRHGHVHRTFRARPSTLWRRTGITPCGALNVAPCKDELKQKTNQRIKNSRSTLALFQLPFSRFRSPALPSSVRASCCLLFCSCPAQGPNVSGRPGSCGPACPHPTGKRKKKKFFFFC